MTGPLYSRPGSEDLPSYYHGYVERIGDVDEILPALEENARYLTTLLSDLSPEQETLRYAPGKWSVREVVGHLVDTERVFQYRALWFARRDSQPLPGYDENLWGEATNAGSLPLERLLEEYRAVRRSTVLLFENMGSEELTRTGEANGQRFLVGALPWFLLGHELHHREVLRERYGL
jgi:uncharacterized damage-inducible protein DinB